MNDDKKYWKGLDELKADPQFLEWKAKEFAEELPVFAFQGEEAKLEATRRDFLKILGFSFGGLALSSCTQMPVEKVIPYLNKPQEVTPGVANWYATTCEGCSASCSLLAKVRDGRPIKIEGNAESTVFQGGVCAAGQATVLSLYDEARLKQPVLKGQATTWQAVDDWMKVKLESIKNSGGRILVLTGVQNRPSLRRLFDEWKRQYPKTEFVSYEAFPQWSLASAYERVFGTRIFPRFRFDRAERVVSFGADFLGTWISPVEFAKTYSKKRNATTARENGFLRHIHFESGVSLSGSNADRRFIVSPREQRLTIRALLLAVKQRAGEGEAREGDLPSHLSAADLNDLADDLWAHREKSLVLCGLSDEEAQADAALINDYLGNIGKTIDLTSPSFQKSTHDREWRQVSKDLIEGRFEGVIFYGTNPLYDAPEKDALKKAILALREKGFSLSFSDRLDETSSLVDVIAPDHHFLESWNDAEPVAGYVTMTQPTIRPLFQTRSVGESFLRWLGRSENYYDYLRSSWQELFFTKQTSFSLFSSFWDHSVERGFFQRQTETVSSEIRRNVSSLSALTHSSKEASDIFEMSIYESVALRDGRSANNPWLQELPDPVTKITWGNYLSLAPKIAEGLGLKEGHVVRLEAVEGPIPVALEVPVQIQPGQHERTVSMSVGYGREKCGKAGEKVGVNAYPLLGVAWVKISKTGGHVDLAATQTHHSMEGRAIVREANLADFLKDPKSGNENSSGHLVSLWEETEKTGHAWGLVVDLTQCTGCSACVVSCQAENNIPVVGKDEVFRRREMHWLRIDRYYTGSPENPETVHQPMMCQHCGNAPCETVCPVLATVHSSDGLNQQVYNRCVGTRYCANNCPYKVRRFNWFDYAKNDQFDFYMNNDLGTMVLNPDIVVRSRGVMEKCSMCVQRIQEGRLEAKRQGRELKDGDIKLACEQSCPAEAIVFGDLHNKDSRVAQKNREGRFYHVLEEINVKPVVGYLTKIRNKKGDES